VTAVRLGPGPSIVCSPCGELEWANAISLRHFITGTLRPGTEVVVDLGHIGRTDAVELSALIGPVRRVRASGGKAWASNPHLQVQRRMQMAGVYGLLTGCSARNGNDQAA
jgi:anti-anti-sigma regulatory factor